MASICVGYRMSQYDLLCFEYEVCKCLLEAFCWLTDIHRDTKALLYPIWAHTHGVTIIEWCPILTCACTVLQMMDRCGLLNKHADIMHWGSTNLDSWMKSKRLQAFCHLSSTELLLNLHLHYKTTPKMASFAVTAQKAVTDTQTNGLVT